MCCCRVACAKASAPYAGRILALQTQVLPFPLCIPVGHLPLCRTFKNKNLGFNHNSALENHLLMYLFCGGEECIWHSGAVEVVFQSLFFVSA